MGESFISIFQQFFASINKIFVWGTLGYNSMNILDVPKSKSYVDLQLVRQLVYTMFITNNHASFHLWGKEILVKCQKVFKYYFYGCRSEISKNHRLPCSLSTSTRTACWFALKFCTEFRKTAIHKGVCVFCNY